MHILHEQRNHDGSRHKRQIAEQHEHKPNRELTIRKARKLEKRIRNLQLSTSEREQEHSAQRDARRSHHALPRLLDARRRDKQAYRAEREQHRGGRIEVLMRCGPAHHIRQKWNRKQRHRDRDHAKRDEHRSPPPRIDNEARDCRADCGREPDNESHNAHGLAVLAFGIYRKRHHLNKRKQNARADRLHQARCEQHRIIRREKRSAASHDKTDHGDKEQASRIEFAHEIGAHGGKQPERENVGRGNELGQARPNQKLLHDGGQRRYHHRLRNARRCCARHHNAEHHMTLSRRQAAVFCPIRLDVLALIHARNTTALRATHNASHTKDSERGRSPSQFAIRLSTSPLAPRTS